MYNVEKHCRSGECGWLRGTKRVYIQSLNKMAALFILWGNELRYFESGTFLNRRHCYDV